MSTRAPLCVLLFLPFVLAGVPAPASTPADASLDRQARLVRAAVEASGARDPAAAAARVEAALDEIAERLEAARSGTHRARRLHRLLHRRYLIHYRADADGLPRVLEAGEFNCLSGVLLYGLAAERLGWRAEVLETPGHLAIRLHVGTRVVDIETTSPRGFDIGRYQRGAEVMVAGPEEPGPAWSGPAPAPRLAVRRASFEAAVGIAWLNEAWRALERDEPAEAARLASRAGRFILGEGGLEEDVRRVFARAFRGAYETGRFAEAYEFASQEVELFPAWTTSRDRFLAAAMKRIEAECEANRPEVATAVLDDVESRRLPADEAERLTRRAAPLIAAAAVRLGSWSLAEDAARRYALAEPDPVEAARLAGWVSARQAEPGARAGSARESHGGDAVPFAP